MHFLRTSFAQHAIICTTLEHYNLPENKEEQETKYNALFNKDFS